MVAQASRLPAPKQVRESIDSITFADVLDVQARRLRYFFTAAISSRTMRT
jgi:hypothetical protein